MGKILDIILVVFLLGIGFVSCGDDGCMENRSSIPLIAFYSDLNPRYKFDTLTFVYHSYVKFESAECGAMFNYVIDDFRYTTHQLVSATLLTKEIDNLNIENVKLFYHVEEAE